MSTPNENSIDRLLRQNRQAARDVEMDAPVQLEPEGLAGFVSTQVEINKVVVDRLDGMQGDITEIRNDITEIRNDITEIREDITEIRNDMGQVKGGHARAEVVARAEIVAMELGFEYLRQVTPTELYRWSKAAPVGTEASDLRSFQRADLVIEALEGAELVYLTVEISYTVDNSDVNRALRNATLLRQITSHRAEAVIAGAAMRPSVQEAITQGNVKWFPTKSGILEPE
jgi:septal ring factor EnvC (AmiA/AmiB activator)